MSLKTTNIINLKMLLKATKRSEDYANAKTETKL